MPTYEYACQSCGHHVEVYQRFTDDPLTVCEVCGGTEVHWGALCEPCRARLTAAAGRWRR